MSWFLADDNLDSHPKVLRLLARPDGFAAMGFWLVCGTWSRRNRTSGGVPRTAADASARKCGQFADASALAGALVDVGLWTETADGYQYNDWKDVYKSDDKLAKRKEKDAERKRLARAAEKCGQKRGQSADSPQDGNADLDPSPSPSPCLPTEEERPRFRLAEIPVDLVAVPATTQPDRRGQPRDQSGSQRQSFADLVRAEAFARDIKPAPSLTDNQRRDAIAQVLQYGEDAQLGFEKAAKALIAQAFDDSAVTGDKFCFAIMDATPGKPKQARFKSGNAPPERELSEPTRKALAEADRLRAAGKFF